MKQGKNNIQLPLLVFYILWGWFFKNTIYSSPLVVYSFIIGFYLLFFLKLFKTDSSGLLNPWVLFYVFIILRYVLQGNLEFCCYWFVSLVVVITSSKEKNYEKVPYKFILYSSLFCVLGEFLQLLAPSWFNAYISSRYINDDVEQWATTEYGLCGFTYQLATTAEILVLGECVLLSRVINDKNKNPLIIIGLSLIIISVLLTGKRMNFAISILLVVIAFFLRKNGVVNLRKLFKSAFVIALVFFILGALFIYNIDYFVDNPYFRRLALSVVEAKSGGEIGTTGRDELWSMAWSLFQGNKLFGIGPSQFPIYSHAETDVHNVYLQTLCELGVVGLVLFITAIVYSLVKTLKVLAKTENTSLKNPVLLSLLLQIVYVIEGYSENVNTNLSGYMIYALAIAILLDCEKRLNKNEYKKSVI